MTWTEKRLIANWKLSKKKKRNTNLFRLQFQCGIFLLFFDFEFALDSRCTESFAHWQCWCCEKHKTNLCMCACVFAIDFIVFVRCEIACVCSKKTRRTHAKLTVKRFRSSKQWSKKTQSWKRQKILFWIFFYRLFSSKFEWYKKEQLKLYSCRHLSLELCYKIVLKQSKSIRQRILFKISRQTSEQSYYCVWCVTKRRLKILSSVLRSTWFYKRWTCRMRAIQTINVWIEWSTLKRQNGKETQKLNIKKFI